MQKIKVLREEKGLTQTYLAEKLGVAQASVCQWELGITRPGVDKLPKLAQLLGCTIDELYDTTNEE